VGVAPGAWAAVHGGAHQGVAVVLIAGKQLGKRYIQASGEEPLGLTRAWKSGGPLGTLRLWHPSIILFFIDFNNSSTASWFLLTLTGWPVHTRHSEQIHGARGVSWQQWDILAQRDSGLSMPSLIWHVRYCFWVTHVGKSIVIGGRHCFILLHYLKVVFQILPWS
jgi:hypothetical protein